MEEIKDLLEEFVDWAKDCGEDAWYIFDNTEEAIERFLKQREQLLLLAITMAVWLVADCVALSYHIAEKL